MKLRLSIIFLVLVQTFRFQTTTAAPITGTSSKSTNASDEAALLSFKSLVDDPFGALALWNASLPFCHWPGVTCGGRRRHPDRVSALDLESLGLTGPIPPSLANLTFLKRLHLPGNNFQRHIPAELGRMYRLQHLNLSSNSLQGGIPDALLNVSTLRNISFKNNRLQGELPRSFPPVTNLDLSDNMFVGVIPPSLGNVSALAYLDMSSNGLTGSIPSSMGMLSSLRFLDLSTNNLTGDIPPSIFNLSLLVSFSVHTNNLSGTLPADMGNTLPHLKWLYLFWNRLSGPIPISISNASGLERIQAYNNKFSGTIPSTLGTLRNLSSLLLGNNQLEAEDAQDWRFFTGLVNCTNLQTLDVSNNMLGGFLPGAITNLSRGLTWLGMNGNKISGSIPPEISSLVGLSSLDLCQNLFTGTVPATIGKLQMLQQLHLSENMLSGEIPSEIGNLTLLNLLYLHENQFSGTIPRTLGKCKKLTSLSLGYNKLSGTIPLEIIGISSLSIYLSFSNNELIGPLPSEVGGLINLETLDVSNNKLYGEIPGTLGDCSIMRFLAMEGNLFRGSIPSSFSQLKGLQELDLSRNNLSGQVPKFFADFRNLDSLNLSFNDLEGEVPKGGALSNLTATSLLGNYKLCGGSPGFDLPPCSIDTSKRKTKSSKLIKIISAVTIALCVIFFSCSLIAWCWTKKSRRRSNVVSNKDTQMPVSYSDLAKATDEFSANNLVGTGSFGSVYRADMKFGKLDAVAVKVIDHQQRGATKTFMAECEALRNVRHRNLVKILTTCSSVDFRGSDFKAFIFEFMPNGSLEKWLHPEEGKEDLRPRLSLLQRLNIAIDVASALDYLHHYADVPIVHCDLKPSNVLLDDDMVAHVGDFGLARFLKKTGDETSIGSSGLLGTIGYVPPEYAIVNKVSTKGDVYSYGILVLEMFTGKKPTDHVFTEEDTNLHNFVETAFPGRVMDIVDAAILLDEDAGDDKDDTTRRSMFERRRANVRELLASVLRVGLSCSKELQSGRLQMGDVVKELVAAKYAFVSDESHEEKYV